MRICPQCRTAYPTGTERCSRDGTRLVDAREFADAQADPLLGATVAGRFHVAQRIGVGGMGTVYRAVQSPLGREVALKILKDEVSWDPDTITRFHREAKAMSMLVHPNTVRVFDFGQTDDGMLFLAMELLEGELVTTKLDREGRLAPADVVQIGTQILASLHEAHTKSIIHRDLKPDNIYLAEVEGHVEPVVKVLDFGIAKVVQQDKAFDELETQHGTVFGTPRYMSPEQAQGKKLDARSDLYSVGVLLYQLLTGVPPFVDDDAVLVMAKHIRDKPVPPMRVAPEQPIPASLSAVIMKALEKQPDRRFQSAAEMSEKLDACLPSVAALAASHGGVRHTLRKTALRLPLAPLAIGGGVLLIALAGGVWALTSGGEATAPPPVLPEVAGPAPAAPVGEMTVAILSSVPEGAEVFRGDESLGLTPLRLSLPTGEQWSVALRKDGFDEAFGQLIADARTRTVVLTAEDEGDEESGTAGAADPGGEDSVMRRRRVPARRSGSMAAEGGAPTSMGSDPYEEFD